MRLVELRQRAKLFSCFILAGIVLFLHQSAYGSDTVVGGSADDYVSAMTTDASGNIYIAGYTGSSNITGVNGAVTAHGSGFYDIIVAKFDPQLNLLKATYLGGSGNNTASAIALDSSGNVYVAGYTYSWDLPVTTGVTHKGAGDAFVLKLNSDLTQILALTYYGGTDYEFVYAMAVDSSSNVYIAGSSSSTSLPNAGTFGGGYMDAFVAKFNFSLAFVQATYLGGSASDRANTIVLDSGGNVYVAGYTASTNFPSVTGGAQSVKSGASGINSGFITKLTSALSISQSTYYGVEGTDVKSLAIGPSGEIYAAGVTSGTLANTSGSAQPTFAGGTTEGTDGFVALLNSSLTTITAATHLGGSGDDYALTLMPDAASNSVYVAGYTDSTNFPNTSGGVQSSAGGLYDGFISKLSSDLKTMQSTYYGGAGYDKIFALAKGSIIFAGVTNSATLVHNMIKKSSTCSATPCHDVVLGKMNDVTTTVSCTYSISPASASFSDQGGTGTVTMTTTVQGGCAWTATASDSWITITSGASGTGTGTGSASISYTISANTSSSSRTGTITVSGQTHTITQSGVTSSGGGTTTGGGTTEGAPDIAVYVEGSEQDLVEIPLSLQSGISFDKFSLNWGLLPNNAAMKKITIKNKTTATAPLTITGISVSGWPSPENPSYITSEDKLCSVSGATLAVGQSCSLNIIMKGYMINPYTVTMSINSNDKDSPEVKIKLSVVALTSVIPAATGTGTISIDVSSTAGASIKSIDAKEVTDESISQTNKPTDFLFPDGLLSFSVTDFSAGSSVTANVTYPTKFPEGSKVYKITSEGWAEHGCATITDNVVCLNMTDGGCGDSDGKADGTIVDPIAVGIPGSGSYALTVAKDGTGSGTVSGSGLTCDEDSCLAVVKKGKSVRLSAKAVNGSKFTSWSGDACEGSTKTSCTFTMDSDKNVSATFDEIPSYTLTLSKSGNGKGSVKGMPKGTDKALSCSTDCDTDSAKYLYGTKTATVTLTASPDKSSKSKFTGWSGDCSGTKTTCKVTMDGDKDVTATFGLPDIDVSETTLDLGTVTKGGQAGTATFTVTNIGDVDLKITSFKLSGTDAKSFKVLNNDTSKPVKPATLSAGGSLTVKMTFAPTSNGQKSATLKIASDDPDEASVSIGLSGTGSGFSK